MFESLKLDWNEYGDGSTDYILLDVDDVKHLLHNPHSLYDLMCKINSMEGMDEYFCLDQVLHFIVMGDFQLCIYGTMEKISVHYDESYIDHLNPMYLEYEHLRKVDLYRLKRKNNETIIEYKIDDYKSFIKKLISMQIDHHKKYSDLLHTLLPKKKRV